MMVLEYRLECGCAQTVRVPADKVEPAQITGTVHVWCTRCIAERYAQSVRIHLAGRKSAGYPQTGKPRA